MGRRTDPIHPVQTEPEETHHKTRYVDTYYYRDRPCRCGLICCLICGFLALLFFLAWMAEKESALAHQSNNKIQVQVQRPAPPPLVLPRIASEGKDSYKDDRPAYNGGRIKVEVSGSMELVEAVRQDMQREAERYDTLMRERGPPQPTVVIVPACSSSCSCRRYCMQRPSSCLPTYVSGTAYYCNVSLPSGRHWWCDCATHRHACNAANLNWRTTYCTCGNTCCGR